VGTVAAPAVAAEPAASAQEAGDEVRDFVGIGGDAYNGGVRITPEAQIRQMGDSNYLAVRVANDDTETASVAISSEYGEKKVVVEPGKSAYVAVNLRRSTVPEVHLLIIAEVRDPDGVLVRGTGINMANVIIPEA